MHILANSSHFTPRYILESSLLFFFSFLFSSFIFFIPRKPPLLTPSGEFKEVVEFQLMTEN